MSQLTKEQWAKVQSVLATPWGAVDLRCDGFEVRLMTQQYKPLRFCISVYVDGWLRGSWFSEKAGSPEEHEIARRFFPLRTDYLYPPKERARFLKKFGKRLFAQHGIGNTRLRRGWHWNSGEFTALRRHFVKHNKSIELLLDTRSELNTACDGVAVKAGE